MRLAHGIPHHGRVTTRHVNQIDGALGTVSLRSGKGLTNQGPRSAALHNPSYAIRGDEILATDALELNGRVTGAEHVQQHPTAYAESAGCLLDRQQFGHSSWKVG